MSNTSSIAIPAPRQATPKQGFVIQLASSLTIMGAVMVAPMLPKITVEFAAASAQATELVPLIATGPALAIALFAPVAGWLADRFGRKKMLIIGTLFYALLGFLPALLTGLFSILIARFAFGCAEAIIITCCTTLIADYWTGEEQSRYINRQVVTIGVVGSIFFVIGGAVGETSWRLPFYLYLLPLLLVPVIVSVLWEPEKRVYAKTTAEAEAFLSGNVLQTIAGPYFLVFAGMVTTFIVPVLSPVLLVSIGVTSSSLIGLSTGLGLLATLLGSIAWPLARRLLGVAGVNAVLLTLIAVGLFLLTSADTYTAVLVAVVIHGIGAGFLVPNSSLPLLRKLPATLRARGVGGYASCLYIGQFLSPLLVMGLAGRFGGVPQGLAGSINSWAVFMLVLAAIWLVVRIARPVNDTTVAER